MTNRSDILIIGAGVAGLFTALKLSPRPVTVVTARPLGKGGSSIWAQGGVAAAMGADDSPQLHLEDTIAAGAGLVDPGPARILCEEGPARIDELAEYGAPFDRDETGAFKLGREAAHRRNRILHATGDQAGAAIMAALIEAAVKSDHITILERIVIEDLLTENGRVVGALAFDIARGERVQLTASETVLATGGLGGLYAVTTNPVRAQGHGLAFAARAGASIRDAEFVQFHPTALDVGVDPAPLATEALRGEGAILVNKNGAPFMANYDKARDLAPRDIVARAVEAERAAGRGAYLDARTAIGARFETAFPTVFAACRKAELNPSTDLIPIAPAAHYHMGGVLTDENGRADIDGLWAIGEAASTGVHGANRLASNSLLEAVVFGARAADHLRETPMVAITHPQAPADRLKTPPRPIPDDARARLRSAMSQGAALLRSASSLRAVAETIETLKTYDEMTSGLLSALVTAEIVVKSAEHRPESRGGHFRADHPNPASNRTHTLARVTARGEIVISSVPLSSDPHSSPAASLQEEPL